MLTDTFGFEISPQDVRRLLDSGDLVVLIDVREPEEHQLARLEEARLIPMRTVPAELTSLEAAADDARLVVFCHHGVRSLNVVSWLRQHGVASCQSMTGGLDRWSLEIDPAIPRY